MPRCGYRGCKREPDIGWDGYCAYCYDADQEWAHQQRWWYDPLDNLRCWLLRWGSKDKKRLPRWRGPMTRLLYWARYRKV